MQKQIVIADDDPTIRSALCEALRDAGYVPVAFPSGDDAEKFLKQAGADLVISDVRMPGIGGFELLRRFPGVPFIMISGFATVQDAVEAMKIGAFDFVVKPFACREILSLVTEVLRRGTVEEPNNEDSGEIVTANSRMRALLTFAGQVAKSHASILIQGESGTGKELLARFIHERSRRSSGPFIAVNCAALPEGLLESELFGHERGAFTGAVGSKPGKFELAHNGTLLLDEISEMPLALQAKLLRVLQEREVDRVGGKKPLPVDIRVIATTNRDLRAMVRSGMFREDLFYRLNVVPIRLLPLKERLDDIEPLARAFFSRNGYAQASLTASALKRLQANSWRGNVRELFNILERAAIVAQGGVIESEHLLLEDEFRLGHDEPNAGLFPAGMGLETAPSGSNFMSEVVALDRPSGGFSVREMEEQLIFRTLRQVNDNRTRAAKLLGISVRTLRNKLKQYRLRECQREA